MLNILFQFKYKILLICTTFEGTFCNSILHILYNLSISRGPFWKRKTWFLPIHWIAFSAIKYWIDQYRFLLVCKYNFVIGISVNKPEFYVMILYFGQILIYSFIRTSGLVSYSNVEIISLTTPNKSVDIDSIVGVFFFPLAKSSLCHCVLVISKSRDCAI